MGGCRPALCYAFGLQEASNRPQHAQTSASVLGAPQLWQIPTPSHTESRFKRGTEVAREVCGQAAAAGKLQLLLDSPSWLHQAHSMGQTALLLPQNLFYKSNFLGWFSSFSLLHLPNLIVWTTVICWRPDCDNPAYFKTETVEQLQNYY